MRRTERLFGIIQALRTARRPVAGHALAAQFEVSLRTLYRDMAELLAQRVPIRGEAGTGYVIDDAFDMPPLMLTVDELEAAALGAAWVAQRGDDALARGARDPSPNYRQPSLTICAPRSSPRRSSRSRPAAASRTARTYR